MSLSEQKLNDILKKIPFHLRKREPCTDYPL